MNSTMCPEDMEDMDLGSTLDEILEALGDLTDSLVGEDGILTQILDSLLGGTKRI
jgi:hypothetical protein